MTNYRTLIVVLLGLSLTKVHGSKQEFHEEERDAATGITYKVDQFGNPNITLGNFQGISTGEPADDVAKRLAEFYQNHHASFAGKAFICNLPWEAANAAPVLREANFTLHHADTTQSQWVIMNGSPMPAAYSGVSGSFALVFNDSGKVLVTADKFRKQRLEDESRVSKLWLPGGSVEIGELPSATAVREAKEETGVDVEVLQKVYDRSRTKGNRYGMNDTMHIFLSTTRADTCVADENEIDHAAFVDINDILSAPVGSVITLQGHDYYVGGFTYDVLKHVNKTQGSATAIVSDIIRKDATMEVNFAEVTQENFQKCLGASN